MPSYSKNTIFESLPTNTPASASEVASLQIDQVSQDALIAGKASQAQVDIIAADLATRPNGQVMTDLVKNPDESWTATFTNPNATKNYPADTATPSVVVADDAEFATGTETTKPPQVKQVVESLALKQDAITPQTSVRTTGTATDADYVTEKAVRDAVEAAKTPIATPAEVDAGTDATKVINTVELKRNIDTKEDLLPTGANKYLKRNAADMAWESVDLPITPQNLISGPGAPAAGDGEDTFYFIQIDAALGTNDIWGPKAAGAWPAQADFKSADPDVVTDPAATAGLDYTLPKLRSTQQLDQWGVSRRRRRVFNVSAPFDFIGLGYADRTAVFIRNTDTANGISVTYGAGGANTLEITKANGTSTVVAGQDTYLIQPSEIAVMEKDGTNVYVSVIPGERVSQFMTHVSANAFGGLPHDGIVLIMGAGEIWARKTGTNGVPFPADGVENADWFKVGGGENTPELLESITVDVYSAGTNSSSAVALTFTDKDGNDYPSSDWVYSTVAGGLQAHSGVTVIYASRVPYTGSVNIGHNKDGVLIFEYVGNSPNGISAVTYVGTNGAQSDGKIRIDYLDTNYNVEFANKAAVTATDWTTPAIENSDQGARWVENAAYAVDDIFSWPETDPADDFAGEWFNWRVTTAIAANEFATFDGANFATVKAKLERFPIGKAPDLALGYLSPVSVFTLDINTLVDGDFAHVGGSKANQRVLWQPLAGTGQIWQFDNAGANPAQVGNPGAADWANGVRVVDLATGDIYSYNRPTNRFALADSGGDSLEIVRYTADGAIQDKDHRAIFETGAVNMTLAASTTDRLIQMVSEGPATIITADGAEEFTSSGGTSTDQKLTLNETFQWATIIGRTAGGWSQYVGQVGIPAGVDESTPTKFKAGTRLVQNGVNVGSGTVTFPEAFKAGTTPTVMILALAPGDNINATLQSVSETGFNAWIVRNENDVGMTKDIHWMAIGEIA